MVFSKRNIRLVVDQILVLVEKDFKVKYNSTILGFLWSILVPVLMSFTYFFVFKVMMRWGVKNYLLYVLSGNFVWHFFSNTVMGNGVILIHNASLLKKTAFNRELLLWGKFFSEGVHFLLSLLILLGAMHYYKVHPGLWISLVNLCAFLIILMFFSLGVSYIYSALNIYFRDLERIMSVLMMLWMFSTPIFIPISSIGEKHMCVIKYNPLAALLGIFRDIIYEPGFHPENWWYPFVCGVVLCVCGRWLFNRISPCFSEKI